MDGDNDDCRNRPGRSRSWKAVRGLLSLKDLTEVKTDILARLDLYAGSGQESAAQTGVAPSSTDLAVGSLEEASLRAVKGFL